MIRKVGAFCFLLTIGTVIAGCFAQWPVATFTMLALYVLRRDITPIPERPAP